MPETLGISATFVTQKFLAALPAFSPLRTALMVYSPLGKSARDTLSLSTGTTNVPFSVSVTALDHIVFPPPVMEMYALYSLPSSSTLMSERSTVSWSSSVEYRL